MEPKPKERIVFDEDSYYGDEGVEWAVNDLMERKGLTEDEVRESFTDDEVFQHAMKLRDFDYEEEMRALTAFFDGKKSDMSDFINPYGGNHIFVAGSVERWDDTIPVITVYKDFDAATDCSPSRFGRGNVFADCEIQKVWDENGTLYLAGAHHDGRVSVEMRQLTDEGERLWGQLDYEDYLPLEGLPVVRDVQPVHVIRPLSGNPDNQPIASVPSVKGLTEHDRLAVCAKHLPLRHSLLSPAFALVGSMKAFECPSLRVLHAPLVLPLEVQKLFLKICRFRSQIDQTVQQCQCPVPHRPVKRLLDGIPQKPHVLLLDFLLAHIHPFSSAVRTASPCHTSFVPRSRVRTRNGR